MTTSSPLASPSTKKLAHCGFQAEFLSVYRLFVPAVVSLSLAACGESLTTEAPLRPPSLRWSHNAPEIGRSGCSFVLTAWDGAVKKLHVPRNELPFSLPQVDSTQIRISGVRRGVLVVANADFTVVDSAAVGRSLVIACLVPQDFSSKSLGQRITAARTSQRWAKLEKSLEGAPRTGTSETPIRTASELLWTSFTSGTWRREQRTSPVSLPALSPSQLKPRFSLADSVLCGPQVGWACATPILKPLVINSRVGWNPNLWVFDFGELEWAARHGYSISSLSSESYSGSGMCADANEFYFAMYNVISQYEAEADAMDQAYYEAGNTNTPTCVIRSDSLSTARYRNCIDIWISGKRSFIFGGDNRGPDSTAGYRSSRFQEYFDDRTCTGYYVQNVSSIQLPFIHDTTASPSQHDPKDLTLTCDPNTGIIDVHIEVYDAYCTFPAARSVCPAANADIRLTPASDGSYEVKWIKDGYPSVAVYQANSENTLFRTLRRDSGNTEPLGWLELITFRNEINRLREALHLPPGCDWQ